MTFYSLTQKKKADSDDESDLEIKESEDEFDALIKSDSAPQREKTARRAASKVI